MSTKPKPSFRRPVAPIALSLTDAALASRSFFLNSPLPAIWTPTTTGVDLIEWVRLHTGELHNDLHQFGGVLLRGFENQTVEEFHQIARLLGEAPVSFASNVFPRPDANRENLRAGSTYPPQLKLTWHNENSFDECRWTRKIMFYAQRPAPVGGETPICDCRVLFNAIHPDVRSEFMHRGVTYIRNYHPELGNSWRIQFNASTRKEVEDYCREWDISCEWFDGDRLRIRCHRPAVIRRPGTGELLWFNALQMWHPFGAAPETVRAWEQSFAPEDFPMTCAYGDGSPIPQEAMAEIYRAYNQSEITFDWHVGDILVLDNILVTHGRNAFSGPREHYVALDRQITLHDIPVADRDWTTTRPSADSAFHPLESLQSI